MQIYVIAGIIVLLAFVYWWRGEEGYERAENEYRLAASESLRAAHVEAEQRASDERASRTEAEQKASAAEAEGEALALQLEAMENAPDPEICPDLCFLVEWDGAVE